MVQLGRLQYYVHEKIMEINHMTAGLKSYHMGK